MVIKTQGTQLYFLSSKDGVEELIQIGSPTSVNLGDVSAETIETTSISSTTRTYISGLESPGEGSIGINLDPNNESHMRLYEIQDDPNNNDIWLVLGLSESDAKPILKDDKVELSGDRSWLVCKVAINGFPFAFEENSIVQVEIPIQRSGVIGLKPVNKDKFAGVRFNKENAGKFIGVSDE